MHIDPELKQFCTARQLEILEAIELHGSGRGAAKALGIHKETVREAYKAVLKKAELQGHSPAHDMVRTVPDSYTVKGISTYYNKEGKPSGQWVKSSVKHDAILEALKEAVSAINDDIGKAEPVPAPDMVDDDLCNVFTFTDYHLGMYAWEPEGGGGARYPIPKLPWVQIPTGPQLHHPPSLYGVRRVRVQFLQLLL